MFVCFVRDFIIRQLVVISTSILCVLQVMFDDDQFANVTSYRLLFFSWVIILITELISLRVNPQQEPVYEEVFFFSFRENSVLKRY